VKSSNDAPFLMWSADRLPHREMKRGMEFAYDMMRKRNLSGQYEPETQLKDEQRSRSSLATSLWG